MRLLVAAAMLLSVACGSGSGVDLDDRGFRAISFRVNNDYAESIFTVEYRVDAEFGVAEPDGFAFDEVRIDALDFEIARDVVTAPIGSPIHVDVTVRSLGEDHEFELPDLVIEDERNTIDITYDFDLAEAAFVLSYGLTE